MVGIIQGVAVENAVFVNSVDAYAAGSVDDFTVAAQDSHMYDFPFCIVEETQVAGTREFQRSYFCTLRHLLRSVAFEFYSLRGENCLGEAGTVDSHAGLSSPQVG